MTVFRFRAYETAKWGEIRETGPHSHQRKEEERNGESRLSGRDDQDDQTQNTPQVLGGGEDTPRRWAVSEQGPDTTGALFFA